MFLFFLLKFCKDIITNLKARKSVGIVGKYELINHHEGFSTVTKLAKTERHYRGVVRQVVSFRNMLQVIKIILEIGF